MKLSKSKNTLFVFFLVLELILYFLNSDKYFQVSGFYYPLVAAVFCGLFSIFEKIKSGKFSYVSTVILLFIIDILISSVLHFGNINTGYLFSYLLLAILVFEIVNIDFSKENVANILAFYIVSATIISLLIIIFKQRFYELEITRITIKVGSRSSIDPNYLGAFLICPILIGLYMAQNSSKKFLKIIYYILAAVIFVGMFMTGSRGAILATLVGVIVLFSTSIKNTINIRTLVVSIIVICVLVIITIKFVPIETIQRFTQFSTWRDGSNDRRLLLWQNAWNAIKKSPIIGLGINDTAKVIGQVTGYYAPCHNTFLEIWTHCGVLGIGSILYLMWRGFKNSSSKIARAVVSATFVVSIFVAIEATLAFWFNIGLAILLSTHIQMDIEG